jgi:hypothetical protein
MTSGISCKRGRWPVTGSIRTLKHCSVYCSIVGDMYLITSHHLFTQQRWAIYRTSLLFVYKFLNHGTVNAVGKVD